MVDPPARVSRDRGDPSISAPPRRLGMAAEQCGVAAGHRNDRPVRGPLGRSGRRDRGEAPRHCGPARSPCGSRARRDWPRRHRATNNDGRVPAPAPGRYCRTRGDSRCPRPTSPQADAQLEAAVRGCRGSSLAHPDRADRVGLDQGDAGADGHEPRANAAAVIHLAVLPRRSPHAAGQYGGRLVCGGAGGRGVSYSGFRPPEVGETGAGRGIQAIGKSGGEAAAIALIIDHLIALPAIGGDERRIGQVLALQEERQALERALLEVIADLAIDDSFVDRAATDAVGAETRQLTHEGRAIPHRSPDVQAPLLEIGGAVRHPARIARECLTGRRRGDGAEAVEEADQLAQRQRARQLDAIDLAARTVDRSVDPSLRRRADRNRGGQGQAGIVKAAQDCKRSS
ncbi:unnamed protein product [Acanthosepion pharaonis]|uniref:Uncharacterized protein n=1 Tax=Acanthosepion pharaonis TaxID=158019 RepID=A0A812DHX9_ACAPH|nr:unnamed protein product [Sepia pharaonis]